MTSTVRDRRKEEGSALLIALVFVTAVALIVAAVLSFADVGLRASHAYQKQAKASYAADGATAAAIRRYGTTGPCDDFTAPPINDQSLIVRCEGPPPAAAKATEPVNSLLSLGTGPGDGISSTKELHLLGDVYSTTTVSTTATMVVQGQVSALKTCTGPIQTAPATPLHCAGAAPSTPSTADRSRGRDPDYTKAASVVPPRRTVPAPVPGCTGSWLITLEPGYYDDAAGLTALTGAGSCNDKVVWFQPGTYYFDFTFNGGPGTWVVSNASVVVVGGTPRGWTANPTGPRPTISVPGSCKTDGDAVPNDGVQLIAGGDGTSLQVDQGRMELCATPSATDQQIALFGLQQPTSDPHRLEASSVTAEGFTNALNAQAVDETPDCGAAPAVCPLTASAALTSSLPTASLAFSGFRPAVPAGTTIDSASLVVKHQEEASASPVTVTADFPGSLCGPANPITLTPNPGAITTTPIDLKLACGLATPEDLAALGATYRAALGSGSTSAGVQVDGVVLDVTYRTPTTRKPTAVLTSPGFANPNDALEIGEQPVRRTADAALGTGTPSASITVAGIGDPLTGLPTIESAFLRVAHQDIGDTDGPTVTVPFASGTCTNLPVPHRPDGITEDLVDLRACGLTTPARLKGLTATFTAGLRAGGTTATSRLDGMWLEVVSSEAAGPAGPQPPSLRQPKNADSTPSATSASFANPERATVIGESAQATADAMIADTADTAALTVDDFTRIPLPAGSKISSAKLRVTHEEDANIASVRLAATSPGATCPAGAALSPPAPAGERTTHEVDLTSCITSSDQLAALSATYTVRRTDTTITPPDPTVPTTATVTDFPTAQADGRAIDGTTADATLDSASPTASVTIDGYGQGAPPAGSRFTSALLRIGHQDDSQISRLTATITVGGAACIANLPIQGGAIAVTPVDLLPCGLTDPSKLAGLSVTYKAEVAPGGTGVEKLDGAVLALTYRPPAVDRLDGIELDVVFQPPTFRPLCSDCNLVKVAPAAADTATRFVASGTVYAPSAGVDISMNGLDTQVLRRGLIARSIKLGLKPAAGYKRATGAIPPEVVTFTAYPDATLPPRTATPTGFSNPENAKVLREPPPAPQCPPTPPCLPPATADAALGGPDPTTASLELKDFHTDLPDTARFDAAVLRVRHQDVGNTVAVTVAMAGVATPCVDHQVLAPNPASLSADRRDGEDQIELPPGCGVDRTSKVADIRVTYDVAVDPLASPPATATAKLDGITLEILSGARVRASVTFDRAKATVQAWSASR